MINKKDKLLTLASGKKYVVIEQCEYNGENYYFANEIIDDDNSDNFKIFTIKMNDKNQGVINDVVDDDIIKAVSKIINDKI